MADETDDATGTEGDGGPTVRTSAGRKRGASYLALGVAALGLVLAGGAGGAAVAVVVAAAWYALPPEYAFAAGQVGLLAVAPDGGLVTALAAAAIGGLLFASLWDAGTARRAAFGGALLAALLGGGAWVAAAGGRSPWTVATALAAVVAVASYGLHRYELVAVGLVEGERA